MKKYVILLLFLVIIAYSCDRSVLLEITLPQIISVQVNPFGLVGFSDKSNSGLGDLDNDGDLDIISSVNEILPSSR